MMQTGQGRAAELVADMQAHAVAVLQKYFIADAAQLELAARDLAQRMADNWGGQIIYFPKNYGGRLGARDAEIYRAFDGTNQSQLAKQYGLSVQQIYKIIKQGRLLHRAQQ